MTRELTHFGMNRWILAAAGTIVAAASVGIYGVSAWGGQPSKSKKAPRLRAVGQWLKQNGEAVYGTRPTPFGAELKDKAWRCTTKPGKLFIHFFQWPAGKFTLEGAKNPVAKAYLLAAPEKPLEVTQSAGAVTVTLPAQPPDKVDSVLVLETR